MTSKGSATLPSARKDRGRKKIEKKMIAGGWTFQLETKEEKCKDNKKSPKRISVF